MLKVALPKGRIAKETLEIFESIQSGVNINSTALEKVSSEVAYANIPRSIIINDGMRNIFIFSIPPFIPLFTT